ncbi:putative protein kinase RLK-Pelle-DLSV family [Helianthus debilis subsp. tardiflorus]
MTTTIVKFPHLQIPLEDVILATDNFHHDNIIGRGGFGPIYKGLLLHSRNLLKIAALMLDHKHGQGDVEFWNEISMLSDLKHTNLVSIIGFCDGKGEKIIITTYAAKESLKENLNNPNLTWMQRLKICVSVARALSYLHYDKRSSYRVIHLNINISTILLDENWEPKLSGFKVSIKQSLCRSQYSEDRLRNQTLVYHKHGIFRGSITKPNPCLSQTRSRVRNPRDDAKPNIDNNKNIE